MDIHPVRILPEIEWVRLWNPISYLQRVLGRIWVVIIFQVTCLDMLISALFPSSLSIVFSSATNSMILSPSRLCRLSLSSLVSLSVSLSHSHLVSLSVSLVSSSVCCVWSLSLSLSRLCPLLSLFVFVACGWSHFDMERAMWVWVRVMM